MDFDNRKVYGDTFISDGLVIIITITIIIMVNTSDKKVNHFSYGEADCIMCVKNLFLNIF